MAHVEHPPPVLIAELGARVGAAREELAADGLAREIPIKMTRR